MIKEKPLDRKLKEIDEFSEDEAELLQQVLRGEEMLEKLSPHVETYILPRLLIRSLMEKLDPQYNFLVTLYLFYKYRKADFESKLDFTSYLSHYLNEILESHPPAANYIYEMATELTNQLVHEIEEIEKEQEND